MHNDASSGGGRPFQISSYKGALISLGQTINFIENMLQWFETNYVNIIESYKKIMSELFKMIPTSLTKKRVMNIKKHQINIMKIGGKSYIDKMNTKLPSIKRRKSSKKKK